PPDARVATEPDGHSSGTVGAVWFSDTIRHRYMSLLRSQSWVLAVMRTPASGGHDTRRVQYERTRHGALLASSFIVPYFFTHKGTDETKDIIVW
ncbi:hypothetical protein, partial [Halocatena pleomorpha]|uniref:hypothetical protein n=1 Tax=Halocatena pleomorpha TaxID=1785090 RepID=UPI001C89461B